MTSSREKSKVIVTSQVTGLSNTMSLAQVESVFCSNWRETSTKKKKLTTKRTTCERKGWSDRHERFVKATNWSVSNQHWCLQRGETSGAEGRRRRNRSKQAGIAQVNRLRRSRKNYEFTRVKSSRHSVRVATGKMGLAHTASLQQTTSVASSNNNYFCPKSWRKGAEV